MSSKEPTMRARVYALANPATVKREEGFITKTVFDALLSVDRTPRRPSPGRHEVRVAPSSGHIEYVDAEMLWAKDWRPRLPNAQEARQRAEALLQALASRLAAAAIPDGLRDLIMVPPTRPVDMVQVVRAGESAGDHWLYRAQVLLPLGNSDRPSIPVFGAAVEVRIGDRGQILLYRAQWRPAMRGHYRDAELKPLTRDAASGASDTVPQNELSYVLEGAGIPQYYLAPFYVVKNEDKITLVSASAYSLTVDIAREPTTNGMSLTASVGGGSGDYAFAWARYSLETVCDEGYRELGPETRSAVRTADGQSTKSTVFTDSGAFVVMVNVKDKGRTGAFRHHQQQIHSVPAPPTAAAPGFKNT